MTYLITYDLRNPGKNYDCLICAIKACGNWAKINQSCWAIKSNQTAAQIMTALSAYLDRNDTLFVADFWNWAFRNADPDVVDWLNR